MEVIPANPGKKLGRRLVRGIKIRKGDEDHEEDRQDREDQHTQGGQRKQGLVELLVRQGMNILFGGLQFMAVLQQFLTDPVLLDILIPGIEETQDKEDGQHTVQQDEE